MKRVISRKRRSGGAEGLRRAAETCLKARLPSMGAPLSAADSQRLVHELQVHQIELELQNEELRQAQQAVTSGLERYTELYDFAPVGYFTLDPRGHIVQANLEGAAMLGCEREQLVGRRFALFVDEAWRQHFHDFVTDVSAGYLNRSCEATLAAAVPPARTVLLRAATSADSGNLLSLVAVDISDHKAAERREKSRSDILALMACGAPLDAILQAISRSISDENPALHCRISLADEAQDGAMADPPPAHAHHLICSAPIRSAAGLPLGSLMVYDGAHHFPSAAESRLIEQGAHLASVSIEQRRAQAARDEADRRFRDLLANARLLAVMLDSKGHISFCNDWLLELTGWQRHQVIGQNWFELLVPEAQRQQLQQLFATSLASAHLADHHEGEILTRDGQQRLIVWDNTLLRDDRGQIIGTASIGVDISERKKAEELIWRQANFDALTELPNRRMFLDRLTREIKLANRNNCQLVLLFIDLDNFKAVNDGLGHAMGDVLLAEAARRIVACVRQTDTVARLGGDEFTVLLTDVDAASSVDRITLEILNTLASPFVLGADSVTVSASIGVTLYPNDAADVDSLLKNADQAMYAAKNLGRNRYSYFTPALQEAALTRLRLINDLRQAVTGQQLCVYFQPIINLTSGAIQKAEALVRWQHPTRGLINPIEFIGLAEETGLIVEIGNWVFREAVRWARRWRSLYQASFQISVNKSPVQFHQSHSDEDWIRHIKDVGLAGSGVVIEITEGLLLDSEPDTMAHFLAYRDKGIQVAIDDFGTGYSALSYLKKFDIDYLKIDREFTSNLHVGSSDLSLSEAIIAVAHTLGLKVIAEGVETAEQRDLLVLAGCDYAQGFLYSRPVPPEQFELLLH